jgi:hypothetical protein
MRILFPNLSRPKAATNWLTRLSPQVKLSAAQEAVARATGYRDWHELAGSPRGAPPAFDLLTAQRVILLVADALALMPGDVQYAVAKARLLGVPWQLDDHLALTTRIWRERLFGSPARGKPGTIVKVRANGETQHAYVSRGGRPTHVVYETGLGICADFEAVTPRIPLADFVPTRLWLPYGHWTLRDGSEVIFSRDYLPLWRIAEGTVDRVDPWLWIEGIVERTDFSSQLGTVRWERGPAREMALDHLARHRIFEVPRLVHALPHLIVAGAETIRKGVELLRRQVGGNDTPPPYARLNPYIAQD